MTAPLLTVDQAASTLLCSRRRVFEMLAAGVLVRGPKYGKRTVIVAESVFNALEAEYHRPEPAPVKRMRPTRKTFNSEIDQWLEETRR